MKATNDQIAAFVNGMECAEIVRILQDVCEVNGLGDDVKYAVALCFANIGDMEKFGIVESLTDEISGRFFRVIVQRIIEQNV